MSSIGWATLDVIPSFKDFGSKLEAGTTRAMSAAGTDGGRRFGAAAALASGRTFASDVDLASGAKRAGEAGGETAGQAFGTSAAEEGGDSFASSAGSAFKKGGLIAGAAAGVAFAYGMGSAIQRGALEDKLAAQLGLGASRSKEIGKVAGDLYAGAYGDSLESVNGAVRAVMSNIDGFRNSSTGRIKEVTATVLDLNAAFEEQPDAITRAASQMQRTGLASSSKQALNIITRGFQTGADKSQDLLDTFNEYGTQFRKLGLNGKQATGLLSQGLKGGARDADLVADSLKEFSLKSTEELLKVTQTAEGPQTSLTALGEAFKAAGYDANDADPKIADLAYKLQNDIAGGGKAATAGLQDLLDGLRETDDPLERSRNAVALFGTQAEDMGDALLALDPSKAERALGRVGGAAERMGNTLNDNASVRIEEFKRTMQTKFVDYFADKVIPVLEDDVLPAVERFADWFTEDGGPALKDFADDMKPVIGGVKDLAGFLNDLPGPAKLAGLGAILGGGAAIKVAGGGGGALGSTGSALGLAKAVRVFETNPAALGGDGVGGGTKGGAIKSLALSGVASIAVAGAATVSIAKISEALAPDYTKDNGFGTPNFGNGLANAEGDLLDFSEDKGTGKAKKELRELISNANLFGKELDLVGDKKVDPSLTIVGMPKGRRELQLFLEAATAARQPIQPYVKLTGYDRAMAQIEAIKANVHTIPSAGVDNGVPFVGGGGAGVVIDQRGSTIVAHDYDDFVNQTQKKARGAGLGGRPNP